MDIATDISQFMFVPKPSQKANPSSPAPRHSISRRDAAHKLMEMLPPPFERQPGYAVLHDCVRPVLAGLISSLSDAEQDLFHANIDRVGSLYPPSSLGKSGNSVPARVWIIGYC